ncbi:MAG TPA: ATP-binding protein [Frankiaceae bacterium]|nr:ATP-binding protein [Frankiaceae bacterium]
MLSSLLVGAMAVAAVAWAWWSRTVGPVPAPLSLRVLAPMLLVVTVASELVAVRLRHGDEDEALTLLEAAVVADVLLLPPVEAMLIAIGGLAFACLLARRPLVKTLFNLGAHAFGTALLVSTVALLAPPGTGLRSPTVAAICLGNVLFGAVNLVLLAVVLAAATGASAQETVKEQWRLSAVMSIGTCGLGAVAVALAVSAPALLPFAFLPAAALTYAYRAAAQEARERVRSTRLAALSQVLVGRLVADDLLSNFLGLLRETFDADTARVILEGDEERPGAVVLAHEHGVDVGDLTATDAALLARTGDVAELVPDGLVPGWGQALLSPLEAEGRRLGALVLVAPVAPRRKDTDLNDRDLDVLAPLLSALGVALRGAEHLSRLVEETGKLHAVVDHSSDGILVLDGEGRVQVWNRAMASISGVPAELANGRSLRELLSTSNGEGGVLDPIDAGWSHLSPETPQASVELALHRPDGEQRWIRASHAAVFAEGPDGRPELTQDIVLVYDVTKARQVERLKADFIATVSHELRTPVTPIKGYIDLLRRRGETFTPERRREMLDMVADRVAHLARLVEDLLLASRVSSPASAVRMGPGDLGQLVERTLEDFSTEKTRLTVRTPSEPVPVECDPVRVVQVLSNLVSNGLKYSAADAPVSVSLEVVDGAAVVEVTDVGRGIPEDQLDRVFEKFHRVEDPLRMTTGGTGLGLFIARQLTEAMSGSLTVHSVLGSGSTFTFTMPIAVAPAPSSTMPRPRAGLGPSRANALLSGPNPFGRFGRPDCGPNWRPDSMPPDNPLGDPE